ncbi:protein phosphatase CheZ [Thermochromatium tepidum]|jgi:Chemotaxis protein|uniref:Protein phosphatase CheZ n=1 Tax=Thermochromatium tepidum ATCC 43061 TaxID=316276 RepID=A0A6I6E6K2_THETI|nr:protein phosphatase CheZ [Thermochromatium tepidum]QGU33482.1 protein phosphatase CheZ [Thermochromatium tepidum ATCC 43061]
MDTDEERLNLHLDLARQLVECLEKGQRSEADDIIRQLRLPYERELFEELGKLTRELHEALKSFRGDARLIELSRDEIPDAKERLNYVVSMTEQATHRTLNALDESMPIAESLHGRSGVLREQWNRFRHRELSVDEFRELARELDDFLIQTGQETERLKSLMSEILMAQDYQDLTGQIIRRVIRLVQEVEENLVGLIRLSSARMDLPRVDKAVVAEGGDSMDSRGHGPIVPNTQDMVADVVSSQDDVDALLSSLGF